MEGLSAGNSIGYAKIATAPREPSFQVAVKKLASIQARLDELCGVAGQASDRIVGAEPQEQAVDRAKLDAVPAGHLDELNRSLDDTARKVERAYRYVTRITNEF